MEPCRVQCQLFQFFQFKKQGLHLVKWILLEIAIHLLLLWLCTSMLTSKHHRQVICHYFSGRCFIYFFGGPYIHIYIIIYIIIYIYYDIMCFLLAWLILIGLPVVKTVAIQHHLTPQILMDLGPLGQVDKQGFQILQELMRILVPRGAGGWSMIRRHQVSKIWCINRIFGPLGHILDVAHHKLGFLPKLGETNWNDKLIQFSHGLISCGYILQNQVRLQVSVRYN